MIWRVSCMTAAAGFALAFAGAAKAYSWPVWPFYRTHSVRAVVGDPRTIFTREVGADPSARSQCGETPKRR